MNNTMINFQVSAQEVTLINELRELGYGEVFDVESSCDPPNRGFLVTQKEASFLNTLRRVRRLAQVIIHDSEPSSASSPGETITGRKILRKYRF
jgi:hypothetical protein